MLQMPKTINISKDVNILVRQYSVRQFSATAQSLSKFKDIFVYIPKDYTLHDGLKEGVQAIKDEILKWKKETIDAEWEPIIIPPGSWSDLNFCLAFYENIAIFLK